MMLKILAAFLLLCAACLPAQAESYRYKIVVLNMPIGEAKVDLDLQPDYNLKMTTEFGGIVALFTGAKAEVTAKGKLANDGAHPSENVGQIQWGKKVRRATIKFDDKGDVTDLDVKPKYSYPPKERHALDPATFTDVKDPLSSMIRPVDNGKLDCTATLRVFDSKERYNLQLSPTDQPMICNVQPVSISGYKKIYDEKGSEPKPLRMTFAPTKNGKYAIPVRIERDMLLGLLLIELIAPEPVK